jgi:para-aminobenzoate synthetase
MEDRPHELKTAAALIVSMIRDRIRNGKTPFLVVLDGGSGAGKSSVAEPIARALNAVLIQSDDFYAAHISNAEWEGRSPAQRAADVLDWRRLRAEALEPLLARKTAKWHPFDFASKRPDGTYPMRADFVERQPADVIILDGAYTSRCELADLINLSVLIDVPVRIRHERLAARENSRFLAAWHARWDAAEAYYFTQLRPKSSFDLVVTF